ncbi:MAG TPA: TIM barrel protein [Phycisphaerae bacterium]|nr:TIM barrel protein [Phycisphaerae bacterium]
MDRRDFMKAGAVAGAAAMSFTAMRAAAADAPKPNAAKFKLKYAPHFGMFRSSAGNDPLDQLQFGADQGFTAWEDNGMGGKPADLQEKIGQKMTQLGMTMGVFVTGLGSLVNPPKDTKDGIVKKARAAIETAKRVNAKWTTVVPGRYSEKLEMAYQTAHVVDNLRFAAEVLEPAGLVMVLESLNWWANHPGLFLTKIPQAYEICRAVNSPSCKILDDLYHQQISEGNLIPNMEMAWSEIGYIQIGDNPGRKEPTTGEINYRNIFKWLHELKKYDGVLGMEHGNSKPGKEGEQAVIDAYRACDDF